MTLPSCFELCIHVDGRRGVVTGPGGHVNGIQKVRVLWNGESKYTLEFRHKDTNPEESLTCEGMSTLGKFYMGHLPTLGEPR